MARRWQPPPMEPQEQKAESKVTVDERVVRKMLKVNPDMRKGRTTFQVKKSLEGGESLATQDTPGSDARAPGAPAARGSASPSAAPARTGNELEDTVDFFVRGKADKLRGQLDEVAARRRQLDEEEQRVKDELRDQVVSFVSLLDETAVAAHGKKALAKHASFLGELGLSTATLLEQVLKTRK